MIVLVSKRSESCSYTCQFL